ncbi:hypothetical protein ILUMI_00777 [Ignelater luminosus]|uniref:non-specific serine/threonine protein kinase n=1 Tax=Ignelater luminosus TaxID=2038154 RepID=A0A8K0DLL3_IGNLU|nr:hypothetical protein ILUMI_00777 [Ignelater luminosus]
MGRRKRSRSNWRTSKIIHKPKMFTKKQLSAMPQPSSYLRPDISVKVRRSLARRAADAALHPGARPVYFNRETSLSPLYNKDSGEQYIQQVFTSVRKIGQGCFGDVFAAISRDDSRVYAIKVTNDTHSFIDLTEVRRFEKVPENQNCVKFLKAWQESYRLYIQMELCVASLDKLLMVEHHIKEAQCWDILTDISMGLKYLHDKQLIHLDIKPANIMISTEGVCKLGDFGLLIDLTELNPETMKRKRTGVSVSEGDGKYVALEVLRGNIYTPAGDMFSLGLMMLEVASDAALPSSGDGWVEIRQGVVPDCYMERNLSSQYRDLIGSLILEDYTSRPSINEVLGHPKIQKTLNNHKNNTRVNYMANWNTVWQNYVSTHPDPGWDIPIVQIQGPSPPRRTYPINYIPPRSPRRTPLGEMELNLSPFSETDSDKKIAPSSPPVNKEDRYKRVSRRLFP